jgi:hypothetical protein
MSEPTQNLEQNSNSQGQDKTTPKALSPSLPPADAGLPLSLLEEAATPMVVGTMFTFTSLPFPPKSRLRPDGTPLETDAVEFTQWQHFGASVCRWLDDDPIGFVAEDTKLDPYPPGQPEHG